MKHCLACKLCTGRIYCLKILEVMNLPLEKKIPKKIREHPAQTLQQGSLWPCMVYYMYLYSKYNGTAIMMNKAMEE